MKIIIIIIIIITLCFIPRLQYRFDTAHVHAEFGSSWFIILSARYTAYL